MSSVGELFKRHAVVLEVKCGHRRETEPGSSRFDFVKCCSMQVSTLRHTRDGLMRLGHGTTGSMSKHIGYVGGIASAHGQNYHQCGSRSGDWATGYDCS